MQRSKSIESITSVTSSCRGGEKKTPPTHMLIPSEVDNKILLLSVAHLVNSSVTRIKINATATFKKDINDRKQRRGKIIQLGTKEICMEQLQVFEMTADANEENTADDEINQINKNEEYDKKKYLTFQTEHRNESSQSSNSQIIINTQPRSIDNGQNDATVIDTSSSGQQERLFDLSNTELLSRYEYLSKKCNELQKDNADLSRECDHMTKEIQMLKRTTMPIPDAAGRQWFINMGKYFANKAPESDISKYATALKIDPRDLIDCIEDTISNTARQVIRLLYSSNQLLTLKGTEVPKATREIIKEFAESQTGPISKRQFNEAINGVFRSTKCEVKKKKKKEGSLMASHQRSTSTDLNSNEENHNDEEDPTDNQ
ncbi:unnamed protein product [Rotaria sp. Silwood1]|nr:unnamed protein product [Rotaria sp. Silwood1]